MNLEDAKDEKIIEEEVVEKDIEEKETSEIIRCLNCGTILNEGQEFCSKCGIKKGEKKELLCMKCGTEVQIGQKFCPKCGEKIKFDSNVIIDSVKNDYKRKINNIDQEKLKVKLRYLILFFIIAVFLMIGAKLIAPKVFVNTSKLLSQGNYKEAYQKANKKEKEDIFWENVLFYVCKEVRSDYKDPSTFDLREAWVDKSSKRIVLKTGGANSYGGIVFSYDYVTFDKDDNKFELYCSLSSLEEEKTYSWDDSSDRIEKILKNAARTTVKEIIRDDSLIVNTKIIDNINQLFKSDKYKEVVLIDNSVTSIYVTESGKSI